MKNFNLTLTTLILLITAYKDEHITKDEYKDMSDLEKFNACLRIAYSKIDEIMIKSMMFHSTLVQVYLIGSRPKPKLKSGCAVSGIVGEPKEEFILTPSGNKISTIPSGSNIVKPTPNKHYSGITAARFQEIITINKT